MERPAKGWLDGVVYQREDGNKHTLSFYDPVRLTQDLEEEIKNGKHAIVEKNLIVVKEVNKANIEKAIEQAEEEGFFDL